LVSLDLAEYRMDTLLIDNMPKEDHLWLYELTLVLLSSESYLSKKL